MNGVSFDPIEFRRDLHRYPELAFSEHRTAAKVASVLSSAGLEVTRGVGTTGVVATLRAGSSNRAIGLRADMDALPMREESGLSHASANEGVFHGCGHDGHTTMLVLAALQLTADPRIDGTVHFIFQPAEEGRAGAAAMIRDGLFDRFGCRSVYALHNWPQLPAGTAATRPGPIMAAADRFNIELSGRGGHAAQPHATQDVLLVAAQIALALNTVVPRRIDPAETAVLSVTQIHGGTTHNVLPGSASLGGTVRTFDETVRDRIEQEVRALVEGIASTAGVKARLEYERYYPATVNSSREVEIALRAAQSAGLRAQQASKPSFASEDFAFMLQARPGAYLWLGQGSGESEVPLHHPCYDFNDEVIPLGAAWFLGVARQELAP